MNTTELTTLFIQQSTKDSEADYIKSLNAESAQHFNVVILTASNEHQAEAYRHQLAARELPPYTEFAVIPDRNGERVGSGGATLSAIKYVKEKYGSFDNLTIACIHSGGDSKRIPTYSALGKLFSPVPRILPNGKPSTLFDEFMISIASMPSRIHEGMLLLSGDVLLLFNPLQIDYSGKGAAAISFKEPVETGKNHGVYLSTDNKFVRKFLHKQSEETLRNIGAVNDNGKVSIDTGAIIFSPRMLEDLYELVSTQSGEDKFINSRVRLSLYGDFLYPLAEDSTLEEYYLEKPEGDYSKELDEDRKKLWSVLRKYRMQLLSLSPAKFVHFGTIPEILSLMTRDFKDYYSLGWDNKAGSIIKAQGVSGYNSVLSSKAEIGTGTYLESSYIHSTATIGQNCVISFAEIQDATIPDNCVIHVLKQIDGKFVCRIFGIHDNPKEPYIFGEKLEKSLWESELYPACNTVDEAVNASLNVYNIFKKRNGDIQAWESADKKSLKSGFDSADSKAILLWSRRMEDYVRMDTISKYVENNIPVYETESIHMNKGLAVIQEQWLEKKLNKLNTSNLSDFSYLIRLYYYLGIATKNENYITKSFETIAKTVVDLSVSSLQYNPNIRIIKETHTVRMPLRVNWGGGWTDTPPHCIEHGGVVLNAAVSLNGEMPITATLNRIDNLKIIFVSKDMEAYGEFTELEELQKTGDPFDPFALQKACLLACGILPQKSDNTSLNDILKRIGGGFKLETEVVGVPKGSGLGTSSILAAACAKAVYGFFGKKYSETILYSTVLVMEQIMSTGGGWQDQVGGITNGIKFITSNPGLRQEINVEHVNVDEAIRKELNERFCLIYTGQRRLAKNLLRDVVGRYLGNVPDSLCAHDEIQKYAVLMKFALERGNVDEFAKLLNEHWKLSKMIDSDSTNTLIEQIFLSIDDLIDARMVCGAGGGGFLQVILKENVAKTVIHKRLKTVFQDFDVDIWNAQIIFD